MKRYRAVVLLIAILPLLLCACGSPKDLTQYGLDRQEEGFYYKYSLDYGSALYANNDRKAVLSDIEQQSIGGFFTELKTIFETPYLAMIYYSQTEVRASVFMPDKNQYLAYYYSADDMLEVVFAYDYDKDRLLESLVLQGGAIDEATFLRQARLYVKEDMENFRLVYQAEIEDWF